MRKKKIDEELVEEKELSEPVVLEKPKQKLNFEKISFIITSVIVFLVPIFFVPVSMLGLNQTKLSLFTLGTLLAVCFYIIDKMRKGEISFVRQPLYLLGILISVTYFVSSWLSVARYKSFMGGLVEQDTFNTIFIGFVFLFLVSRIAKSTKKIFILFGLFLASVLVAMLSQLLRVLVGGKLFSFGVLDVPTQTLAGSWGDITILSVFFLAVLLVLLETVKLRRWVTVVLSILLAVPFFFIVLSQLSFDFYFFTISLLSLIAVASLVIFAYLFSLRRSHRNDENNNTLLFKKRSSVSSSLIVLLLSIILVLFGGGIGLFLSNKTGVVYLEGRPNWQATYQISKNVLSQRPFLGSGPNTFGIQWNLNKSSEVNNYIFWNNEFNAGIGFIPSSSIAVGMIGFILWLVFYGFVFLIAFRTLFGVYKSENVVLATIIALSAVLSSLVLIFYSPGFVVQFANLLFIGLLLAINTSQFKVKSIQLHNKQWQNFVSTIFFVIVLMMALYWMYLVIFKALANYYYRQAVLSTDTSLAIQKIQSAVNFDPTQALYYDTAAQIYAVKVANMANLPEEELVARKDEVNNDIVTAVNFAVAAENIDPTNFHAKILTGKILEFFGTLGIKDANKTALERYLAASAQSPSNPLPLLFASNVALTENQKVLAKEYLTKAIALKSDYSDVPQLGYEIQALIEKLNSVSTPVTTTSTTTDEVEDGEEE